jgi:hypothetical protein
MKTEDVQVAFFLWFSRQTNYEKFSEEMIKNTLFIFSIINFSENEKNNSTRIFVLITLNIYLGKTLYKVSQMNST